MTLFSVAKKFVGRDQAGASPGVARRDATWRDVTWRVAWRSVAFVGVGDSQKDSKKKPYLDCFLGVDSPKMAAGVIGAAAADFAVPVGGQKRLLRR